MESSGRSREGRSDETSHPVSSRQQTIPDLRASPEVPPAPGWSGSGCRHAPPAQSVRFRDVPFGNGTVPGSFRGSSTAERATVTRLVGGSNPSLGALVAGDGHHVLPR